VGAAFLLPGRCFLTEGACSCRHFAITNSPAVAWAQQPKPHQSAIQLVISSRSFDHSGGIMLLRMTAEGRLLGFDIGDWLVLLCGFVLAGSLALLV
jgi:hypothetical protein